MVRRPAPVQARAILERCDKATTMLPVLESERLLLRPRTVVDLDFIAELNADPEVMRYIAAIGDQAMGRDGVAARSFLDAERGLGYWTVFAGADEGGPLGYVGLIPDGDDPEQAQISYRFASRHWDKASPVRRWPGCSATASRRSTCRRRSSSRIRGIERPCSWRRGSVSSPTQCGTRRPSAIRPCPQPASARPRLAGASAVRPRSA
jgi:hypothetical protein